MYNINNRDACPTNSASLPSTLDSYNIGSTPCKFTSTTVRILPMQVHSNEPRRSTERNSPPCIAHLGTIYLSRCWVPGRKREIKYVARNEYRSAVWTKSIWRVLWVGDVSQLERESKIPAKDSLPERLSDGSTRDHVNRGPDGRVETRQSWT